MMAPKKVWKGFLFFLAAVASWFTLKSLYLIYGYLILNGITQTQQITTTVIELSSEAFVIEAAYTYEIEGKTFQGKGVVNEERFRNDWAAHDALQKEPLLKTTVWYSSLDPQHSALQKKFPVKECISTLLLWGVFIYFLFLRKYVAKYYDV